MPIRVILASALIAASPAMAQFEDESVRAFRTADVNADEFLTFQEFRTFINTMATVGAPMSVRIRNLGAYRIAFRQIDANSDGLASPQELRAAEAQN